MAYTLEQYKDGEQLTAEATANAQNITVPFINEVISALGSKVRISSTVRGAKENARVGGVANSKHLVTRALAVDFVPSAWTASITDVVRRIAAKHGFGYLEHNVKTGQHIHCEYKGGASQKKTLNKV